MPFDSHRRTNTAVLVIVLLTAAPPRSVRAQTLPPVGSEVVVKPGVSLKVGDAVVDTGTSPRIYKVERSNGNWLWLVSGPVAGWARSADAIPLDQAVAHFTAEIERDPQKPSAHYNRGLIHQRRRDMSKALADYSEALRRDRRFAPALVSRGVVWQSMKSYDKAIADYTAALESDPKNTVAYQNRGNAWLALREFDKAIADYDQAIELGLKKPSVYNNRGHARELKRDFARAIDDYGEAIGLDPKYVLAWINRGNARKAQGEYEKALADYAEAIRLAPNAPEAHARRAWILATCPAAQWRNGKEAVELATSARKLSKSTDGSVLDVLAAAHAEAGKLADAIFFETQAIKLASKPPATEVDAYRARLKLYKEDHKPYRDER